MQQFTKSFVQNDVIDLYDTIKVEAIKLAVSGLYVTGISSKNILMESIRVLREQYEWIGEKNLLYKAVNHIYAYIDLGYPFEEEIEEFDKITKYLGYTLQEIFPERMWKYTRVRLNKTRIRNLIGKWNPRIQSMKIEDVVSDIYNKVSGREVGNYLYHTGKILVNDKNGTLWQQTYWLYVREDEAVFHDINRNKYYIFE